MTAAELVSLLAQLLCVAVFLRVFVEVIHRFADATAMVMGAGAVAVCRAK